MGRERYMKASNLTDLLWQDKHSTVDLNWPWNRLTMMDLFSFSWFFQDMLAASTSLYLLKSSSLMYSLFFTCVKTQMHCYRRQYAVEAQTSLAPLSWFHGSRVTTAHAHQCCIFQSYEKTVPMRMKLTMREPASMTTDTWSRRVTSDFNSAFSLP